MRHVVRLPKSKFIVVACKKCKNSQVIFNKVSKKVLCVNCKEILAEPTGGVARVHGKVLQQLS